MNPLPSAMVSAEYPVTDEAPESRPRLRALVNQEGVMPWRFLGTSKPFI